MRSLKSGDDEKIPPRGLTLPLVITWLGDQNHRGLREGFLLF